MTDDPVETTRATFDAAADHFDDPALSFFVRIGARSGEHAGLQHAERVLDVCCGTGTTNIGSRRPRTRSVRKCTPGRCRRSLIARWTRSTAT